MIGLDGGEEIDLAGAWEQMEPEHREAVRRIAERRASLGFGEQEAAALAARREMIEQQADQAVEAVLDAARRGRVIALAPRLAEMAAYFESGRPPSASYADLARFLRAVVAVLHGEPAPAVAGEYAERLATVERAVGGLDHEDVWNTNHTKVTPAGNAKHEEREDAGAE